MNDAILTKIYIQSTVTGTVKIGHICTQNLDIFLNFNLQYPLKYKSYDNEIFMHVVDMYMYIYIAIYEMDRETHIHSSNVHTVCSLPSAA